MKKKAAKKPAKKAGKKKKTAKKKTAKKKAVKPKARPVTLTITGGVVSNEHQRASKSRSDHVVWHSNDVAYTLTFNRAPAPDNNPWPFTPNRTSRKIEVPANGDAGPFIIRGDAVEGGIGNGYGYSVTPQPSAPRPTPEVIPDP